MIYFLHSHFGIRHDIGANLNCKEVRWFLDKGYVERAPRDSFGGTPLSDSIREKRKLRTFCEGVESMSRDSLCEKELLYIFVQLLLNKRLYQHSVCYYLDCLQNNFGSKRLTFGMISSF